jgi:hypothetical protein
MMRKRALLIFKRLMYVVNNIDRIWAMNPNQVKYRNLYAPMFTRIVAIFFWGKNMKFISNPILLNISC